MLMIGTPERYEATISKIAEKIDLDEYSKYLIEKELPSQRNKGKA